MRHCQKIRLVNLQLLAFRTVGIRGSFACEGIDNTVEALMAIRSEWADFGTKSSKFPFYPLDMLLELSKDMVSDMAHGVRHHARST